jgi:uncharacterized protein YjbI with pentapeptide repeats
MRSGSWRRTKSALRQLDSEERASKEASSEEQASGIPTWLVVTAGFALTVVAIVIVYGYLARPKPDWIGVTNKNVWDWLDLLVVPAALAIGVYWLNTRQAARQQREEDRRQAREEAAQEAQVQHALEVEDQRAQDEALQAYLDQMSGMLIPKTDQPSLYKARQGDSLSSIARARTLTVLTRLDGYRKARVVQFLHESGLIAKKRPIVAMRGADLSGAKLRLAKLSGADPLVDLIEAVLFGAALEGSDMSVDLSRADLSGADLFEADLRGTDLNGAKLSGATLRGAKLRLADLRWADLRLADLSGADLSGATGWTEEQFDGAKSLKGATMPNGQKYEDWLKSKTSEEENRKPS